MAGGVGVHNSSHFIMNGGLIYNNMSDQAGGVSVGDLVRSTEEAPSTFVMNGGVIEGNIGWSHSGGINIYGNGDVTINGGEISNNIAGYYTDQDDNHFVNPYAVGGGISVSTGYVQGASLSLANANKYNIARLVINDALIDGNKAAGPGGGVYVNSDNVTINKAEITNNISADHGGGIYLSIAEYTLRLGNALITENSAVDGKTSYWDGIHPLEIGAGGGVWFCPTADAEIRVTDGTAIFGNTALNQGDDVSSESKYANAALSLDNRILGGGSVDWYHDRDGSQTDTPVTVENESGEISLKSSVLSAAQTLAASLATVIIKDNTAVRGGGVGSNGSIYFGETTESTIDIKAIKQWDTDGLEVKLPDQVTVNLTLDDPTNPLNGQVIDTVILNEANNWQASFLKLPNNIKYKVNETAVEGFTTSDSGLQLVSDSRFEITFTNKANPLPIIPEVPGNPSNPSTPETPVTPEVPSVPETPNTPNTPETPNVPGEPAVPEEPATPEPETPAKPEAPAKAKVPTAAKASKPGIKGDVKVQKSSVLPQTNDANSHLSLIIGLMILVSTLGFGFLVTKKS